MFFLVYKQQRCKEIMRRKIMHKICKVRKRRHWNPLFGHMGDEISQNREKEYTGLQGVMKLSLAANLMLN
jgi:hypothetical protein